MGLYKNTNGVLAPIAGRGKAEYGASTYREKTISFTVNALSYAKLTVTFDEPMPDANYIIAYPEISTFYSNLSFQILNTVSEPITANGFTALVTNTYNGQLSTTVKFKVYKLYTDNEYNDVLQLSRPDLWPLDTEIAFENGLYGMHKAGNITLTANTQSNLIVVPKSAGLTTTAKFIDRGGWWQASPGSYKYFIDVNWGTSIQTCYWLDIRSGVSDVPCIRLAFQAPAAGTYAYDTWVTYTKS